MTPKRKPKEKLPSLSPILGAPTKYKPEYCQQLFDYFNQPPYELVAGREVATDYKSLNNFACKIGVSRSALYEWSKKFTEFGEIYELAQQYQEYYLTVNGLKGHISTPFAQFIAINHLDMRTKARDEAPDTVVNTQAPQMSEEELDKQLDAYEKRRKARSLK